MVRPGNHQQECKLCQIFVKVGVAEACRV